MPFGQIYTKKIPILAILGAVLPHFQPTVTKFGMRVRTWDSVPQAKFCKKSLKVVYPFWANLYQKLTISAILGVVSPHFKSENSEI